MTTAREIVTDALKEATVIGVGQTPLAEDMNDGFKRLRSMIAQWQARRWMVPALQDIAMPGNSQRSNTVGPGGYFELNRPVDIKSAYFVQINTGPVPVSLPLTKIFSYEDYALISVKTLNSLPNYFFYDGNWPKGNVFFWPIPNSTYEMHILVEKILAFTGISEGAITTPGAGYVDAVYSDVPLTGGSGDGALADITVAGNVVTNVQITDPGQDYVVGNILSASNANLGGVGAGFTWTVTELDYNLDYEFILPDMYEEALMYNLAVRMISMFGVQNPSPQTGVLAKVALNTIKKQNSQIPTLKMPPNLRRRKAFNLWNADGY